MAEFPVLPLFTDALKSDTDHLSTTEFGAYMKLLITAWRTRGCRLPDDDRLLARYAKLTPGQWRKMKPIIADFFKIKDGHWTQGRLTDEYNHVKRVRETQILAGKSSALKRKGRHSTGVGGERQGSDAENARSAPTPLISPSPIVSSDEDTPFNPPQPEWSAWIEMRRKLGKPPTEHAVKLALAKLERLQAEGHDPSDVLNQSTLNSYTGLFPIKEARQHAFADGKPSGWR